MNTEEHANLVNERARLQTKLAIVEDLEKNSPGNHILATEKNKILSRLNQIDTTVAFTTPSKTAPTHEHISNAL